MASDTTIPLQVKLPEIDSPTNALMRLLQLQNAQRENEMGQLKAQATRRDFERSNKLYELMTTDPDAATLRRNGFLKEANDMEETAAKTGLQRAQTSEAASNASKSQLEVAHKQVEAVGQGAGWLMRNPSLQNAMLLSQNLQASGSITPEVARKYEAMFQADPTPEGIARAANMAYSSALATKDQLLKTETRNTGGNTDTLGVDPVTGATRVLNTVRNTQSPDNIATNATHLQTANIAASTSRANNAANIQKDYRVAGLNPDGTDPNGTVGGLTPEAIDNAARRYNFDGTLPPSIGRGTQGARDLRAIQNRAAELNQVAPGDTSGGRANQMTNKADAASYAQLTKQQQMAFSFERTANANAELALGLSKKMDRTGVPLINAGLQAWRTGTGSPEATQFAAANETFVNEYAKIMSGGMGNGPVTDSARAKAHSLLSTAMTPEQYEGNVRLLQTEMQNRMKGYQDQANDIQTRMRGGGAAENAHAPAAPAGGGIPAGWTVRAH